jgi:hypothetical protein
MKQSLGAGSIADFYHPAGRNPLFFLFCALARRFGGEPNGPDLH